MSDLARAGLFALSLASVVASSLALAGPLRLGGTASLLAVWIIGAGQIVVIAEALSLLHALDWPGFLLGHLLIGVTTASWIRRQPPDERWCAAREIGAGLRRVATAARDRRTPAVPLLVGATLLVGLISGVVALWVPPNDWDSLSYHMGRVGFYLQFGSFDPYPTDDPRQILFAANAEILKLWTITFLRSDRLANLVQLAAWAISAVAVYGLGRQIGLAARGALLAAGLFALLPQSVLQSTTTMNDLVVVSFVAASLVLLTRVTGAASPIAPLALAGAAVGLAVGTKGTALLALPGLAAIALVLFGRQMLAPAAGAREPAPPPWRFAAGLALGGAAAALLGSYFYVQNWLYFGSPTGPLGAAPQPPDATAVSLLALPVVAVVGLIVVGRRLWVPRTVPRPRRGAVGLALGGVVAVLLGSYIFAQGWRTADPVDSLAVPGTATRRSALATNLARYLYMFAFADLSGPLADPWARPLTEPLVRGLGAVGERLFSNLVIPTVIEGLDTPARAPFTFDRQPSVQVFASGVGPVGGLMLAAAAIALIWPRSTPLVRRLLAFEAVTYLPLLALVVQWNPQGVGRFLLTACAIGAPLLGLALQRSGGWCQVLAIVLVLWSAATGLYTAAFNQDKPLARLPGRDRIGLTFNYTPSLDAFFREADQELGPNATVAVFGHSNVNQVPAHWEYPLFGPRFERTVLPLVGPNWAQRIQLERPPPWTNASLLAAHPPDYLVLAGPRPGAEVVPPPLPGPCYELPLQHGKPRARWEVWRCDDRDPRSVVQNGDFRAWSAGPGPFAVGAGGPPARTTADGWEARAAGGAGLRVSRLDPAGDDSEPFRLRLDYTGVEGGGGGIVQTLPLDERLRGATLVVDVRVQADQADTALLRVGDGVGSSEDYNRAAGSATLRVRHRVDERATRLQIALVASRSGQDATILVRSILAIPR